MPCHRSLLHRARFWRPAILLLLIFSFYLLTDHSATAQTTGGETMPTLERLVTTREVAERLRVREQTVRLWRLTGKGPRYIRLSNSRVGYDLSLIHI